MAHVSSPRLRIGRAVRVKVKWAREDTAPTSIQPAVTEHDFQAEWRVKPTGKIGTG